MTSKAKATGNKKEETQGKSQEQQSRIRIKIKAYDHKVIDQSTRQIVDTAQRTGAKVVGPVPIPTEVKKMTVNRSTFKHKSSRNQYEIRIHKRLIDIVEPSNTTIDNLTNMDLPAGVGVEIRM
jgi:small subunit ribosomal protein S10